MGGMGDRETSRIGLDTIVSHAGLDCGLDNGLSVKGFGLDQIRDDNGHPLVWVSRLLYAIENDGLAVCRNTTGSRGRPFLENNRSLTGSQECGNIHLDGSQTGRKRISGDS